MTQYDHLQSQNQTKRKPFLTRAIISAFTIIAGCSLLTFSGDTKVNAQTSSGSPVEEIDLPMSRRIVANLVAPSVAQSQFMGATARTIGAGNWANEAPEVRALAEGLGANETDKLQFAQRVHDYMARNVDVEFRFGVGKGARGTLIDLSGTSFDQAELMSRLLRIGGVSDASVVIGTVDLTPAQFGAWSGLVQNLDPNSQTFTVNAKAACHLLADGGIPGTVNGATNCDQMSGNATSITLAHAWVRALGRDWDTTIRKNKIYADLDIPQAMGCGTFAANNCGDEAKAAALAGSTSGTFGGAPTLSNVNANGLSNYLKNRSIQLMNALAPLDKAPSINQALGGMEIDATAGYLVSDALIGTRQVWGTYASGFPDQFRTKLTVNMGPTTSVLWGDEIAGRRLVVYPDTVPAIVSTDFMSLPKASLYLDKTLVASFDLPTIPTSLPIPGSPPVPTYESRLGFIDVSLKLPHSDAGQAALLGMSRRFSLGAQLKEYGAPEFGNGAPLSFIVVQLGNRSERSSKHQSDNDLRDVSCVRQCLGSGNEAAIAAYLDQSGAALSLLEKTARAEISPFFSLGVVSNDLIGTTYNLVGSYSVVSKDGNENRAQATARLAADLDALLEASSGQQLSDSGAGSSAVNRLVGANSTTLVVGATNKYVLVTAENVAGVDAQFAGVRGWALSRSVASGNSVLISTIVHAQIQVGLNQYASTINWFSKGGSSDLRINSAMPQDNLKQNRLTGSWGAATITSGDLVLDLGGELTVGTGKNALSFSRSYSSAATLRESTESARTVQFDQTRLRGASLADETPYQGPDSTSGSRVGGGWMHSFQESAAISNAGSRYLRPKYVADSADVLAYMTTALDLNEQADIGSVVSGVFASSWLSDQFLANVIVVQAGGSSQSYIRQADGRFLDRSKPADTVEASINRTSAFLATSSPGCSSWPLSQRSSRVQYEGSTLRIRSSDGTVSNFELDAKTAFTDSKCNVGSIYTLVTWGPSFVISSKQSPSGLKDAYSYGQTDSVHYEENFSWGDNYGIFGGDQLSAITSDTITSRKNLVSVSRNDGTSLSFSYASRSNGLQGTITIGAGTWRGTRYTRTNKVAYLKAVRTSDGRSLNFDWSGCNGDPNNADYPTLVSCSLLTVTRPDGSALKYDYAPGVDSPDTTDTTYRGRYLLRRWYSAKDGATPAQIANYNSLGQLKAVASRNSIGGYSTTEIQVGGILQDEASRLVRIKQADGGTSSTWYGRGGIMEAFKSPTNVQTRYEYDGLGRVTTAFFEESQGASWKPDCLKARGSRSNCWRTEYEYDDRGNVTKETKYPYMAEGDYWWGQVEITDAAYSVEFNKPLWVRGPYRPTAAEAEKDKKKTTFDYNARGLLVKLTQPVVYDSISLTDKAPITEYEYDIFGRQIREKAPSGIWTETTYGEAGQPVWCPTSVTKKGIALGSPDLRTTATCNAAGDVATATDANGNTTSFAYDAMRRKVREDAPLDSKKAWKFDLDGNQVRAAAWDGRGSVSDPTTWPFATESEFSPTGKIVRQRDPAGDEVQFAYDALDRISIKTDPEFRQVLTCYNASSQVLEEWRGTGLTTGQCGQAVSQASAATPQRYVRNQYGGPNGALVATWDPNNNLTTFTYEGHGNKIISWWPDGKSEYSMKTRTADAWHSQVVATKDREDRWAYVYYDALGRPQHSYAQTIAGDFQGSGVEVTHRAIGGNVTWKGEYETTTWKLRRGASYEYDNYDRLLQEWTMFSFKSDVNGVATCWTCDAAVLRYNYDNNGNRVGILWYKADLSDYAKQATYSYDALNRMTGVNFGYPGGAGQGSVAYGYDLLSRRTSVTRSNGTRTDYAYETDSDLDWMREQFAGGATANAPNATWMGIDYGYDKSGRQTLMASTDNRIMGAMPMVGTNSAANNLNQVANVAGRAPMTWSDAGNMKTDGRGTTFTHDGRNRLIKAVTSNGTTLHYAYNSDGYRIESVKNPSSISNIGMPVGGTRMRYVLSGSEEVADLDANKNALRYFIPGPAIDERVAQVDANGAVTFMHNDKQNSVIAISDAVGNPVVRRGYGTYGETDPAQMVGTTSAGTSPHPFGYTGRRWDPDLGLYYYRARWYDPTLGTFLQTDPIGSLDYINLYAYVGLEPGNATDPTGKICVGTLRDNNTRCTVDQWKGVPIAAARRAGSVTRSDERNIAKLERNMTSSYRTLLGNPNGSQQVSNGQTGRNRETIRVSNGEMIASARYNRVNVDKSYTSAEGYQNGVGVITFGRSSFVEGANTRSGAEFDAHQSITFVHESIHGTQSGLSHKGVADGRHSRDYDIASERFLGISR
jgi:RHS repeat-associated protein